MKRVSERAREREKKLILIQLMIDCFARSHESDSLTLKPVFAVDFIGN